MQRLWLAELVIVDAGCPDFGTPFKCRGDRCERAEWPFDHDGGEDELVATCFGDVPRAKTCRESIFSTETNSATDAVESSCIDIDDVCVPDRSRHTMNIVNVRLSALAVLFTLVACDKAGDQADVALAAEQVETTETAVSGSAASVATNEPEQTPKEIPKPPPSAEGANSAEGRPAMKGCYVSGRYYPHLAKFKVDCHLCSCSNGGYVCTRNNCATGDPLKSNLR